MVARGIDGGLDAGRRLRIQVYDYIRTLPSYAADDRVVIHVYANTKGLSKACRQANIVRDEATVADFAAGMSLSHPLTAFIDPGAAKEAADTKVRGILLHPHFDTR
jgi:hypothetical protein